MKKQQPAVVPTPPKSEPKEEGGNIFSSLFQSAPKKAEAPAAKKEAPVVKKEVAPAKDDKADAEARLKAAGAVVAKQRKEQMDLIKKGKAPPKPVTPPPKAAEPKKEEGAGIFSSIFGSSEKG